MRRARKGAHEPRDAVRVVVVEGLEADRELRQVVRAHGGHVVAQELGHAAQDRATDIRFRGEARRELLQQREGVEEARQVDCVRKVRRARKGAHEPRDAVRIVVVEGLEADRELRQIVRANGGHVVAQELGHAAQDRAADIRFRGEARRKVLQRREGVEEARQVDCVRKVRRVREYAHKLLDEVRIPNSSQLEGGHYLHQISDSSAILL